MSVCEYCGTSYDPRVSGLPGFCGPRCIVKKIEGQQAYYAKKRNKTMNKVLLRLEVGKDILTKTVEMTDLQVQEMGQRKSIRILGRIMPLTEAIFLDSDPKWTVNINFTKFCDKDESIRLCEFVKLQESGWTLKND